MPNFDRQLAHRLLTSVIDMPVDDRRAFLDRECAGDIHLHRAVERLLSAAEAPSSAIDPNSAWSDQLWQEFAAGSSGETASGDEVRMLGRYRIINEIGRGGMAVVYRAERADQEFKREVAIKILRGGFESDEVISRFEQERQILADLDHPNIARLLDAGRTPDGRPFVVMELVQGEPIDEYCRSHQLALDQRLEIFCVVAQAVGYAHRNLIVHRDLKPSNILVSHAGEVKLLDFGIARLLETGPDMQPVAPPTRALLRLMTPEYASPELLRGDRITTASDTYQLGLLLYELLVGKRPYALDGTHVLDVERAIRRHAPTRPSSAVITLQHAQSCRTISGRLSRRLRGDLDNIVLTALRREPERRYASCDQFAQDIDRYRSGRPVAARADSLLYRSGKFFRRHAIATTSIALAIIGAIALTGFHLSRVESERNQARFERDRAEIEAATTRQVSEMMVGLFESANPRQSGGNTLSPRDLLDRGVERAERDLRNQPLVQAQMFQVLGRTYTELGAYLPAADLLNRSYHIHQLHSGTDSADQASVVADLGLLHYRRGDYAQAKALLQEATLALGPYHRTHGTELTQGLLFLGELHRRTNQHDQASELLNQALELQIELTGAESAATAEILHAQAAIMTLVSLDQAESLFERVLAINERELGPDHPKVGIILRDLAAVRLEQGKLDGNEAMLRRSVRILEDAYGSTHTFVGNALSSLGNLLIATGDASSAIEVLERALAVQSTTVGTSHPESAYTLAHLGRAFREAGRFAEAHEFYGQSAAIREAAIGQQRFDSFLFHVMTMLASTEADMGDTRADLTFAKALIMWSSGTDTTDTRLSSSLHRLGRWLVEQQRCQEAQPLLQRAVELHLQRQQPASEDVAELRLLARHCNDA